MWAHYAVNHTGLMFELDLSKTPFRQFRKSNGGLIEVNYRRRRRVPLSECRTQGTERFIKIASRKGRAWEGEEEIRLMFPRGLEENVQLKIREAVVEEKLITLLKITELCIVSVTTGLRASENLKYAIKKILETRFTKTKLFQAKCHIYGFTMVREPVSLLRKSG
jgi:hypothetical protein